MANGSQALLQAGDGSRAMPGWFGPRTVRSMCLFYLSLPVYPASGEVTIIQSAGGSGFRRFGIWPRSVVSAATHGLVCLSFWVSQGGVLLLVSILLHDISFNLGDTAISFFPRVPWFHYLIFCPVTASYHIYILLESCS